MKKTVLSLVLLVLMLALPLCGALAEAGGEITVLFPPWSEPSKEILQKFEAETGIKVNLNIMGWDQIHDKITVAAVSGTAPADVIEVDWSWVTEFKNSECIEPLTIDEATQANFPLLDSFTVDGVVTALPYLNDFRMGYYNAEHFEKAGIDKAPETWDELVQDAVKIKEAGICEYPLVFLSSPTEGTTTQFFWLTMSRTGEVFNEDGTLNRDNMLASLQFVDDAMKVTKIIDPAMSAMNDQESGQVYRNGDATFMVAGPSGLGEFENPEISKVVGKIQPMLIPGGNGIRTATFGLPGGAGIAKHSKNKEAARKFIDWYADEACAISMFETQGNLPANLSVFKELVDSGAINNGQVALEQAGTTKSPFPLGIQDWYAEFSSEVANQVNRMAQGGATPEQVADALAAKVDELMAE